MKHLFAVAALAAVVVVGVSCGHDGPSGPVAGTLSVRLTSPNSGADEAILVTVAGPTALTSAAAGPGLRLFQQPLGGATTRFALVGRLNTGATILTIGVGDVSRANEYRTAIDGIAQPDYQLRSLDGYQLTVVR
ncbi:MAG: hypothetical protein AUH81_14965 [Candidatus Rokubacteria bacterium 13_1_40CM_4_69_5]|nr:MAG: hypothetical protein AUH81_14965 [Candidatus Rokubacteria bacterium 13_1_40CM_4_69_5]